MELLLSCVSCFETTVTFQSILLAMNDAYTPPDSAPSSNISRGGNAQVGAVVDRVSQMNRGVESYVDWDAASCMENTDDFIYSRSHIEDGNIISDVVEEEVLEQWFANMMKSCKPNPSDNLDTGIPGPHRMFFRISLSSRFF